ncbi:hypothetical protein [Nocardiopsis valliformis]|uniref:hypothetical protein n=1 Tax=Nocardiopsis valliformis TaxID=239974 RepID=UPI0003493A5F|nr:hypothetical protein [Nocardiopsis valliformis]
MSANPMPLTLRVARALLYITAILGLLMMSLMLIGVVVMTEDEVVREMGVGKGATFAFMVPPVAFYVFTFYLAATLRRGGRLRQLLMRVLVALLLVNALVSVLMGDLGPLLDALSATVVLILHESRSARAWYRSQAPSEAAAGSGPQAPETGETAPEAPGVPTS